MKQSEIQSCPEYYCQKSVSSMRLCYICLSVSGRRHRALPFGADVEFVRSFGVSFHSHSMFVRAAMRSLYRLSHSCVERFPRKLSMR